MSGNVTCTATFGHRLTVAARLKSGSPYTDVQWTSSPAGINCRTGCAATFASGTVVTLYTSEGPSSWSGDCSLHQSLTMDGDKTCIAVFNNYLGPIRLGAQASSAVESAASGAAVVTTSMDTPTTLQVVEYYHLDVVGSVRAVTDADGTVIARHDFRPFGEELSPQIPPHDRKLFTGQERDFETGLDYFYARQLRVDLGRFTTPDPVADLAWTDPTLGATNAYGYVQNNPLGFIDPSGMQSEGKEKGIEELGHIYYIDPSTGLLVEYPAGYAYFVSVGASYIQYSTVSNPQPSISSGMLLQSMFGHGPGNGFGVGWGAGGDGSAQAATTKCAGWARVSAVGGNQANAEGALYSHYPNEAGGSIRGGTFGTVAVQVGFLALSTRNLRTYGTRISITPAFSSASVTELGGPAGPWTVSDYGDANIQAVQGVALDLYRFPTVQAGMQFGIQNMPVVISFPTASGASCPSGYTVVK